LTAGQRGLLARIASRFQFARRVPGKSGIAILWWDVGRVISGLPVRILYHLHVVGRERVPERGPVLFVSNHQSLFDPVINGAAVADRQFSPIARESLFRFRPFGWLIRSYGALSVTGAAGDAGALKLAIGELAAGRCVLIYPEGTRSNDGTMKEFERGVLLLQRRAKVDVLPMGIDGAFDVWPRRQKRPSLFGRVEVRVGAVISAAELSSLSADAAMALLRERIGTLQADARASISARTNGRWPKRVAPSSQDVVTTSTGTARNESQR